MTLSGGAEMFPHEPQQGVRVALLEHLGGHVTTPPVVPGAPHGTDSPVPDRVDQFVPACEDLTHGRTSLPFGCRSGDLFRGARLHDVRRLEGVTASSAGRSAAGLGSALVGLVVRDRVGRTAGTVDPEDLC